MAFILNIETATKNCSVSLAHNGITIALAEYAGEGYAHAEKLHVFIQDVVKEAGIDINSLNAVAVSMGPGSYTGLRIGVSAAKGLCYALSVPLIAINTLELIARQVNIENGVIIPVLDARRMEVYSAVFSGAYEQLRDIKAEIITEESFSEIDGLIHLAGDGAAKCKDILNSEIYIYHDDIIYPSAAEMSELSYNKYKISDTVDVAYFEPFYLKDFVVQQSKT